MATQTPVSARVRPFFAEEPEVRELLAEVSLPPGVVLQKIDAGEDHTGDPAMWFIFGVSESEPLTKDRVRALSALMQNINHKMLDAGMPKWPYVRFVDIQ